VRIINLSLLNTDWYIQQLRDLDPKVPIGISDDELKQLGLVPWKTRQISLDVPASIGEEFTREFQRQFSPVNLSVPDKITFEVKPALNTQYGPVLRIQDFMILRILNANKWKKPLYFAVTVAKSNMLSELQEFLRMDGLALKLVPFKNWKISPDKLEQNLTQVYQFRGLQDPDVYYDKNIEGLLQNYRTAFLQVIEYYARENDKEKMSYLLSQMEEKMPSEVIPWTNRYLRLIRDSYTLSVGQMSLDSLLNQNYPENDLQIVGENLYRLRLLEDAQTIFEKVYESNPNNVNALSILIDIYDRRNLYEKGVEYLKAWLEDHPTDPQAKVRLSYFESKVNSSKE